MSLIRIEFEDSRTTESYAADWPQVPEEGQTVTLDGTRYEVGSVVWHAKTNKYEIASLTEVKVTLDPKL